MRYIWRRVAAWFGVTDEEHVRRIRRMVGLYDRWRWPHLVFYIALALAFVGLVIAAGLVLPGLMQGAIVQGWAGFVVGGMLGVMLGGLAMHIGHGLVISLASLRTERLLLRYHDALMELAQGSPAAYESVESRA